MFVLRRVRRAATLAVGVWPQPLVDLMNPAIAELVGPTRKQQGLNTRGGRRENFLDPGRDCASSRSYSCWAATCVVAACSDLF